MRTSYDEQWALGEDIWHGSLVVSLLALMLRDGKERI
jgi:hypothetical protein